MSQVPASPASGSGGLPRVQPASVFGVLICCVGYIWTLINYFQACAGINKIEPSANLQGWTILVPIYGSIYLSTVIQSLNRIAQARQLPLPPLSDNIVLNILFPLLPLYQIFERYNAVADAVEGKTA